MADEPSPVYVDQETLHPSRQMRAGFDKRVLKAGSFASRNLNQEI
jgi:hypothetical protein